MSSSPPASGKSISKSCGNILLDALSDSDRAKLLPRFDPVEMVLNVILEEANRPVEFAYFPLGGILSRVAEVPHNRLEIGIIGREGMSGLPIVLGTERSPHQILVQAPGTALRIGASDLQDAIRDVPPLLKVLNIWIHLSLVHSSMTALANARHTIEERLARWLVMSQDRLQSPSLPLTHEFLSIMLGVHRPGVTLATHTLEGAQLIKAERGKITIRDRQGLIELAGSSYGVAESEAKRLLLC